MLKQHISNVSRKPQYEDVYRRTIEMPQRAHLLKVNCCLKIHNVHQNYYRQFRDKMYTTDRKREFLYMVSNAFISHVDTVSTKDDRYIKECIYLSKTLTSNYYVSVCRAMKENMNGK